MILSLIARSLCRKSASFVDDMTTTFKGTHNSNDWGTTIKKEKKLQWEK